MWCFWDRKATSSHFSQFLFVRLTWLRSGSSTKSRFSRGWKKKRNENDTRAAAHGVMYTCTHINLLLLFTFADCKAKAGRRSWKRRNKLWEVTEHPSLWIFKNVARKKNPSCSSFETRRLHTQTFLISNHQPCLQFCSSGRRVFRMQTTAGRVM